MENDIIQQDDLFIGKCGSGRFTGFRFYADKAETAPLSNEQGFENDDLVSAFTKRAARFCASSNGDFTLSSDGIIRWIGQPVGQLKPTEDLLRPTPILLADAQLMGQARDDVITRLERFVVFHFETVLKSLFDLRSADSTQSAVHTLISRLADSFGILPRRDVATMVKNLNQEARTVLRNLGVRFGAFHIYLPEMLKPSSVRAITLLWSLKNKDKNQEGLSEILLSLSSGRTSLSVNPAYNKKFYHLAGYCLLGKRAVRIDILERLANLIRSALSWKPETEPKPAGSYDGKSFLVTPMMMSILGASGVDMEEILKGLGYRSRAINRSELEHTSNLSSENNSVTVRGCPEAEWVGTPQPTETRPSSVFSKEKSHVEDCVPQAEFIGDFAKSCCVAEKDTIVLLWRYNTHTHRNTKSNQKRERGNRKILGKDVTTNNKIFSRALSRTRPLHKYNKNRPDPDSPFAKLAALRDQLKSYETISMASVKQSSK